MTIARMFKDAGINIYELTRQKTTKGKRKAKRIHINSTIIEVELR